MPDIGPLLVVSVVLAVLCLAFVMLSRRLAKRAESAPLRIYRGTLGAALTLGLGSLGTLTAFLLLVVGPSLDFFRF